MSGSIGGPLHRFMRTTPDCYDPLPSLRPAALVHENAASWRDAFLYITSVSTEIVGNCFELILRVFGTTRATGTLPAFGEITD